MGWTDEKVNELRKLWDKGLTANEIAKALDVTKNAVVGKVHRLCLKARPSPIKTKADEEAELNSVENAEVEVGGGDVVESESMMKSESEKNTKSSCCEGGKIKLIELDSHTCRWPIGDPRDEDFGFCGKKVRAGQTYCDEHSASAYVKTTRR